MADDKRSRDLELLKNAVDRSKGKPKRKDSSQILYRGQPVAGRGGRGGSAPGAPGSGGARPTGNSGGGGADVKEALRKLTQLFNDGLITTAEYDAKRAEILDRL